MKSPKLSLVVLVALVAAGCSFTDYEEPVTEMSTAISNAVDTIDTLDRTMTAARNADFERQIEVGSARLKHLSSVCVPGSEACALTVRYRDQSGASLETEYPVRSIFPEPKKALQALKAYTANLVKIVSSDTAGKVRESAAGALGSLQNLETSIVKANGNSSSGGTLGNYSEPALAAIEWVVGQYVDRVRHSALKRATSEAQPILDELANLFNTASDASLVYEVGAAEIAFGKALAAYNKQRSRASASTLVKAANAYDKVLKAKGARPLVAFVEAHRRLNQELNGKTDLKDVAAAIQDLVRRAKEFRSVVKSFTKASGQ